MDYQHAANVATVVDTRRRIMNDPDRQILDKIKDLTEIHHGLHRKTPAQRLGHLMNIAMGASYGVGVARGVGTTMDLPKPFQNKLETMAMGLGAIMKSASDDGARQAFRIGFMKAACEAGVMKKTAAPVALAPMIVTPDLLLSLPRAIGRGVTGGARSIGAGLGAISSPTSGDVGEAELEVTRDMLRQRLADAEAERSERRLRKLLARRKG